MAYERILKDYFGMHRVSNPENAILDEVMQLKPKHIITTNFDTLIEKYLQDKEEALHKKHSAKEGYAKLVKCQVPKKLIEQCWNCYQEYYRGTDSWLLIDIYPFAEDGIKREITTLANQKIKGMEITLLREFLDRDILSYSGEIEQVLLDRCQRFSKLSDWQRGESGSIYSPLTHILLLWQNGKIPQIEIFHEYKWLDP